MKSKLMLIMTIIMCACALSACGSTEEPASGGKVELELSSSDTSLTKADSDADDRASSEAEASEPADAKSEPTTESDASTEGETSQEAGFSDLDAAVVYNGVTIAVNADFSQASLQLGAPDSKQENPNCISGETGYTYLYGCMTVNVYISGDNEFVEAITVDGDSNDVKTAKGIAVGSDVNDITAVYGEANSSEDFLTEYKGSSATVLFYTENGKVTGMFMTKNY